MAENSNVNQTVTLDASQFISATQQIAQSCDNMTKAVSQAASSFQSFNSAVANIDAKMSQLTTAMQTMALGAQNTQQSLNQLASSQGQMVNALNAIAISTRAGAISLDALAESSKKTGEAGDRGGKQFLLSWQSIGRILVVSAIRQTFFNLERALMDAAKSAIIFGNQMSILQGVISTTGANVGDMGQKITSLSVQFGQPIAEVMEASLTAVRTGLVRTEEQFNSLAEAMRLSAVTGENAGQTVQAVSSIMRGFGLATSEAARVTGILNTLFANGFNAGDVENSIGRLSAGAKELGLKVEDVAGALLAFQRAGLSTSSAVQQLQQIIRSAQNPTGELKRILDQMRVSSFQAGVEEFGFARFMQMVTEKAREQGIALNQVVHTRGVLAGLQGEGLTNAIGEVSDRNAQALRLQQAEMERNASSARRLSVAWNELKTNLQSDVGGQGVAVLAGLAEGLVNLDRALFPRLAAINQFQRDAVAALREFEKTQSEINQMSERSIADVQARIAGLFRVAGTAAQQAVENQAKNVQDLREQAEAAAKVVIHAFEQVISGFASMISKAESQIQDSLKRVQSFAEKTDADAFQRRLKSLGEVSQESPFANNKQGQAQARNAFNLVNAQNAASQQQINSIQQRSAQLARDAAAAFERGDEASVNSGRRMLEERRRITEQLFDAEQERARRTAQFNARATGRNQTFNPFNRERQAALQAQEAQERVLEERRMERLRAQAAQLRTITDQERERLSVMQQQVGDLNRFRVTDNNGQLRPEFRGPQGEGNAQAEIDRLISRVMETFDRNRNASRSAIDDAERRGTITRDQAESQRARLPSNEAREELRGSLDRLGAGVQAQIQALEHQRRLIQLQEESRAELQRIRVAITEAAARAGQAFADTRNAMAAARDAMSGVQRNAEAPSGIFNTTTRANQEAMAAAFREAQRTFGEASRSQTPENVANFRDAIQSLIAAFNTENARRREVGLDELNPGRILELQRALDRITTSSQSLTTAQNQQLTAVGQAGSLEASVANALRQAPQNISEAGTAAAALATSTRNVDERMSALATTLQATITAISNLPIPRGGNAPTGQPGQGGGDANPGDGFATGGLIGNRFSVMGPDNVNINARKGEFVVNPESTRRFYSSLVAINRGDNPSGRGYARGGTVTNTIGNMTFHVNGAEKPEHTAREVIKLIRREQRRGNV